MKYFAVLDNDVVSNTIHADNIEVAQAVTGKECIEFTEEQGCGYGWVYNRELNVISPPQPYPSWTYSPETNRWHAPTEYPEFGIHYWDEETLSWIEMA